MNLNNAESRNALPVTRDAVTSTDDLSPRSNSGCTPAECFDSEVFVKAPSSRKAYKEVALDSKKFLTSKQPSMEIVSKKISFNSEE